MLAFSFALHLIATVVWLGGMSLMVLIVWPLRQQNPEWEDLADRISQQFEPLAQFSLVVLLLTGVMQMGDNQYYEGFLQFDSTWSQAMLVKHLAFVGMMGITGMIQFVLAPALERSRLKASSAKKAGQDVPQIELQALSTRQKQLTQINFILGIIVLICTVVATAVQVN